MQSRIADVWIQYFQKKAENSEMLRLIVTSYYFLIGPLRLKRNRSFEPPFPSLSHSASSYSANGGDARQALGREALLPAGR